MVDEFVEIASGNHDAAFVAGIFFEFVIFFLLVAGGGMKLGFKFKKNTVVAFVATSANFFFEINPIDGLRDEVEIVVVKIEVLDDRFMVAVLG